jgi:predicted permease
MVAKWTLNFVYGFMPADVGTIFVPELDGSILAFSAVLALGTGVLFGLFPALQSTRLSLVTMLKSQSGQSSGGGRGASRFRTSLATVQVALSMALLVAAGLFLKSLYNVSRVNLGVNIDHVVTFLLSPGLNGYSAERSQQLFAEVERQLKGFPGVKAVSSGSIPILGGGNSNTNVSVEGFRAEPDTDTMASYNNVGASYLHTLEIPLLAGRDFTEDDVIGATKVVIVNEQFVKKFKLGSQAIGKHIGLGFGSTAAPDLEIVGVTRDTTYSDVKDEVPALFFRPYRQLEDVRSLNFYVRSAGDPGPLFTGIRKVVTGLDANLPVVRLRTLEDQFRENVFLDRMMTIFAAAFAVLATLLAAIGLYGVLAYTVIQRTKEIGVRMALGATPGGVRMMVIRQVSWMAVIGCSVGAAGALLLGRLAESLLFGLQGSDPIILAVAATALAAVALAAGAIPAHRASKVEPMRALRYE